MSLLLEMKMERLLFGVLRKGNQFVIDFLFYFIIILIFLDAFDAHKSSITQMFYEEETRTLISSSKDRSIKVKNYFLLFY